MKYLKLNSLSLYLCLFVSLFSCRKEVSTPLAPEPVTNLQYAISDGRVNLTWQPSGNGYDAFQLELSRMADFSVINENIEVNGNVNQHSFWRLPLGEVYHVRVRAASALNGLFSDWATLSFETVENNILYSIAEDKVTANSVMFNWSNPDDGNNNQSGKITHIELRPFKGAVIRHNLLAQDLSARQTSVSSLAANMQYVATIYNDRFPLGTQTFATHAQPEGNTWKLEPYSDLVYAIKAAKNNDILLLNEGIYNYATVEIPIDNKIITIKAAEGVNARPRLYTRLLSLQGALSGLNLERLEISGARLDSYKQELPDAADHQWNDWVINHSNGQNTISLKLDDCIVRNYHTGLFNLNGSTGKVMESITINNSILHHLGADNETGVLNVGAAQLKKAVISNSTFYLANKIFIVVDAERNPNNVIDFTFKNNTVDSSFTAGGFDFKAVKAPSKFLMENNIISNLTSGGNFFLNFAYTANNFEKRLAFTNFYKVRSKSTIYGSNSSNMPIHSWELRHPNTVWTEVTPGFTMNDASHANPNSIKEYPFSYDPQYKDKENGDFTVNAASPLRANDQGRIIGDPRWW